MPSSCPITSASSVIALPRPAPAAEPAGSTQDRERELVAIVEAARAGDAGAWTCLVGRFDGGLRRLARSYRLAPEDVDDVIQSTWLELVNAIGRIREPAAIGGWLATVTRRNALRCRERMRERVTDDPSIGDRPDDDGPEARALAAERRAALAGAIAALPERDRRLLAVLLTKPELGYRQVGEQLSMPVGSIGPVRARALARLAGDAQLRAVAA